MVNPSLQNWLKDSNIALLRPKPLECWVVLYTENCSKEANLLVSKLRAVTDTMHITVAQAAM